MLISKRTILASCAFVVTVCVGSDAFAQQPGQTGGGSSAEEAAREKVWNSPDMLRARAWMEDYFRVSRKYTPEKAAEYRAHLKAMTPQQMEIWLMKFDHEREMAHQRTAWAEHARSVGVAHDLATLRQSQKTVQDINTQENQIAAEATEKREQQQRFSEALQRQSQAARDQTLLNTYRPGFLQGGVYHYHYHIYP